jgi:hypothetical protein
MYGLIVIGDDLSSHVAAAVSSRNGINTALLSESGIGEEICLTAILFLTLILHLYRFW